MPLNLTLPANNSPIISAELRDNFAGLKDYVDLNCVQNAQYQIDYEDTAHNPGIAPLGMAVSDPPTQAEVQAIADKVDELINALTRA